MTASVPASPTSPPAATHGTFALTSAAARLSETVALLGAGLYALGVLRITGELRELRLSTPTVLSDFSHHDVLMEGVGVLVSHLASSLLMGALLALFASRGLLESTNRVVLGARPLTRVEQLLLGAGVVVALLTSRFWEGAAYVLVVAVLFYARTKQRAAVGRGLVIGLLAIGVGFAGVLGSYLHAPPLMTISATDGHSHVDGYLVGSGDGGEWFVAVRSGGSYSLRVLGGDSGEHVDAVRIHPADDRDYRTVLTQALHGFSGYGHGGVG